MILTVLMLLIYLVISAITILLMRNRALDILRVIAGVALLLMMTLISLEAPNPDGLLIFSLAISLFIAVEITAFKEAKAEITERLGYEPDAQMLADELGWSLAETARMDSELRKDYIASQSPDVDLLGDAAADQGREREVLRYIWHELTSDERLVFEYTLGLNGKPALSAGDIAKKMGTNQPKISRIRKKIDEKIRARGI